MIRFRGYFGNKRAAPPSGAASKPWVNVSGVWKQVTPYVRVGGVWKPTTMVYVKVSGVWKQVA